MDCNKINYVRIKDICIDLDGTVTCGQIFRYEKEVDNSYTIILSDRVINIKFRRGYVIARYRTKRNIKRYKRR